MWVEYTALRQRLGPRGDSGDPPKARRPALQVRLYLKQHEDLDSPVAPRATA